MPHSLPASLCTVQAPEGSPRHLGGQHACIRRLLRLALHPWRLPHAPPERDAAQHAGRHGIWLQVSCTYQVWTGYHSRFKAISTQLYNGFTQSGEAQGVRSCGAVHVLQ
jgi:hypothetical protein